MKKRTHTNAFPTPSIGGMILYSGIGTCYLKIIHTPEQFITIMKKNFPETKNMTLGEMLVFSGAENLS